MPSNPAPTSSTIAVASSSTTSLNPRRCQVFPDEPRSPSAMPARTSERARRSMGASEQTTVAASAIAPAHASTRTFRPTPLRNGIDASIGAGMSPRRTCISQPEIVTPATLPSPTSTRLSVTNCRTSRAFEAPSALRTASSRLRLSERTSTRLATLTQAMSSSRPAPPSSTRRIGRMSPTITSDKSDRRWRPDRGSNRDTAPRVAWRSTPSRHARFRSRRRP